MGVASKKTEQHNKLDRSQKVTLGGQKQNLEHRPQT